MIEHTAEGKKDFGPTRAKGFTQRSRRIKSASMGYMLDKLDGKSATEVKRVLKAVQKNQSL